MVCKYHEVLAFVREHNLLNDLDDETVKENFDIFPHACSFDKELHANELDCENPNVCQTGLHPLISSGTPRSVGSRGSPISGCGSTTAVS